MSTKQNPDGHDEWSLYDHANDNLRVLGDVSRAEAEERLEKAEDIPGTDPELYPPGESPGESSEETVEEITDELPDVSEEETAQMQKELEESSGSEVVGEVEPATDDLPNDPSVADDPVDWLPTHFIDNISGVPTVNRKGYAVIAAKYGVSVESEPVTLPSETDFTYAEFRAVATTADGETYSGFGSAHVDRKDGDDPHLLGELAETRAMKRATAWATGVGLTAVEEMKNEL